MENWRNKEYLKLSEIRGILSIGENTVYKLVKQMPHIKIGKEYRIPRAAFEQWLKTQERKNA